MGQYAKIVKRKKKKSARRLLPQAWEAFIAKRIVDITALVLVSAGLFILLSIVSYSHTDPSLNTASAAATQDIHNWLYIPGAYAADFTMQTIGFGGLVFSLVLFVWGLRLWKRQELRPMWLRFSTMIAGALFAAMAFARIPAGEFLLHPYLGGSGGTLLLDKLAALFHLTGIAQPHLLAAGVSSVLALGLTVIGAAIKWREIKAFASFAAAIVQIVTLWLYDTAQRFCLWVRHYNDPAYATAVRETKPAKAKKKAATIKQKITPPLTSPPGEDSQADTNDRKASRIINKPAKTKRETQQTSFPLSQNSGEWELPPVSLLDETPESAISAQLDEGALQQNAELLQNVLNDFNIDGEIVSIHPGPVVTLYELEPAPGTKTARIISLSDDIARSMAAVSVRCAVIPGRNVIGIELPNSQRQTVYLREMLESGDVRKSKAALPLILGKDIGGHPVTADLVKMPHLLVAGTTGSGKSVAINTMILSLLYRLPPEKCRFIMIDPKMLELSVYEGIPHLLSPVVTEPGKAIVSLKWTVQEMENRYRAMSKLGVRNIEGYNARIRESLKKGETLMRKVQTGFDPDTGKPVYEDQPMDMSELPYIVVVVDEFADLMLVAGKDVENAIQRLAQMARAAGIHLIMATQRPSVDVITGVIKANFPTRISFSVTSKVDSRTILGDGGAEQLLGLGDMLYMAPGGQIRRVHGPFVNDDEVEQVVSFLKEQGEPQYIEEVTEGSDFGDNEIMGALFSDEGSGSDDVDELYDQAVAIVASEQKASTSFIQRQLQIGYNRAARIIEEMERQGVVSKATATGKRDVLVGDFSDA